MTGSTHVIDDDCELPPHLIDLFLRSAPGQLQMVVEACGARDVDAVRTHAHKLKGGLYAAGASRLADSLEALRSDAAALRWSQVDAQLRDVKHAFDSVLTQLRTQLARDDG